MQPFLFFTGYYEATVPSKHADDALCQLQGSRISFYNFRVSEDLAAFRIHAKDKSKVVNSVHVPALQLGKLHGLPNVILRYRKRAHILILFILFFLILTVSQSIVWDVRIYGNSEVSDEEILQILDELNFRPGIAIKDTDLDRLHNRFLLSAEKVSWISVNMDGVIANVEVREYDEGPSDHPLDHTPRNMVASSDGQIATLTVESGKKVVEVGQTVKKGDLLISGIIDSQSMGIRVEHAAGAVYAYVNKEILLEIPLQTSEKQYTGKKFRNFSVDFFGKTINIFPNSRNPGATCDKIDKRIPLYLFGRFSVPITITAETYREYREIPRTLTVKEGTDLAMVKLSEKINEMLENVEIISKTVSVHYEQKTVLVSCALYCIENIAEPLEFKTS